MKPLYFFNTSLSLRLLYVLLPWCVVSQIPQESNEVDKLLEELYTKTTAYSYGNQKTALADMILYDRAGGYAGLKTFNKVKENTSNGTHLQQALFEMRKAARQQAFHAVTNYKETFLHQTNYDTSYLGILNTAFQSLNYTIDKRVKAAVLYEDNKLKLKDPKQPLFNEHEALVISPFREYFTGNIITLKLNKKLLFSEHPYRKLESVELYSENGQQHHVMRGGHFITDAVHLRFSETGEKTLNFKVQFTNGKVVFTKALIYVRIPQKCQNALKDTRIQDFTWTSDISYQGYNETTPIYGELECRIYFQTRDKSAPLKIKKPIIIIDGFDPLDGRKIEDCDPRDKLSDDDHDSIRDMMKYLKNGKPEDIINELRELGYDVVIVNHPVYWRTINRKSTRIDGGADYIERNGLNHVSLYQEINRRLKTNGSTEELVIVGPSMGGQISRYALAYMEKHNIDHNTRLWVSVDSPHLGANIPLGLQAALNQAKPHIDKANEFVRDWLGSNAAKQQLIAQMDGSTTVNYSKINGKTRSQGFNSESGHPFFKRYYNNMFRNGLPNSKGYPQQTRNISLVNGSLTGSKSYYNPFLRRQDYFLGNSVLGANIRTFQRVPIIPPFWYGRLHVGSFEAHSMPAFNRTGKISRFKKVFKGDSSIYVRNINSRGNLDNIPGGYFQGFNEVLHGQHGSDPVAFPVGTFLTFGNFFSSIGSLISDLLGGAYSEVRENEYVHSFIPTVSALGHFSPDINWNTPMNTTNLTCRNQIPFDSYYGESVNTGHTTFNENSMSWFVRELNGIETNPIYPSLAVAIKGPELMCSSTQTYKIADQVCDVPSKVRRWTVSSGLQINSQNNLSVSVSATGIKHPYFETVTAELENGKTIYKGIAVQRPVIFGSFDLKPSLLNEPYRVSTCEGFGTEIENEIIGAGFDKNSRFEWEKLSGSFYMFTFRNTITIMSRSTRDRIFSYKVRVRGNCGSWSDWRTLNVVNPCYTSRPSPSPGPSPGPKPIFPIPRHELQSENNYVFEIYPNPASHYFTVKLKSVAKVINNPIAFTLYDITNRPVKSGSLQVNNNLFVGDVKEGVYILSLKIGDYEEKQKVIISRPQSQ